MDLGLESALMILAVVTLEFMIHSSRILCSSTRLLRGNDAYKPGFLLSGAITNQHSFNLRFGSSGFSALLAVADAGLSDCATSSGYYLSRPGVGDRFGGKAEAVSAARILMSSVLVEAISREFWRSTTSSNLARNSSAGSRPRKIPR